MSHETNQTTATSEKKRGRFSKKEDAILEQYYKEWPLEKLAAELNRDPDTIRDRVKEKFNYFVDSEKPDEFDITQRPWWAELRNQFTAEELNLFRFHWSKIISQFKDNVIATEELQIVDLIRLEILINRIMSANKDSIDYMNSLKEQIEALERLSEVAMEDEDFAQLNLLQEQMAGAKASMDASNKAYEGLLEKKNRMLKDMRATREQRVKRFEESKESFIGWMTHLATNPDKMIEYGKDMEKLRLGMVQEQERLSEYHTYEDGTVDQPFLNADTVK